MEFRRYIHPGIVNPLTAAVWLSQTLVPFFGNSTLPLRAQNSQSSLSWPLTHPFFPQDPSSYFALPSPPPPNQYHPFHIRPSQHIAPSSPAVLDVLVDEASDEHGHQRIVPGADEHEGQAQAHAQEGECPAQYGDTSSEPGGALTCTQTANIREGRPGT